MNQHAKQFKPAGTAITLNTRRRKRRPALLHPGNQLTKKRGESLEEEVWGRNLLKVSLPLSRPQTTQSANEQPNPGLLWKNPRPHSASLSRLTADAQEPTYFWPRTYEANEFAF